MFDILSKYQAGIFLTNSKITPNPKVISTLLAMFGEKGFLPTTIQEIGLANQPGVKLRMNTSNNEWGINFLSNRIDIEKNPTEIGGDNLGEIEDFVAEASIILGSILEEFEIKGNRIALISSGLLEEMSNQEFDATYSKFFNLLPFHKENLPFEWSSKSASHFEIEIQDEPEGLNVISNVNRINGQFVVPGGVSTFDRLELAFDINTAPLNNNSRFTSSSFGDFFSNSIDIREIILSQIMEIING